MTKKREDKSIYFYTLITIIQFIFLFYVWGEVQTVEHISADLFHSHNEYAEIGHSHGHGTLKSQIDDLEYQITILKIQLNGKANDMHFH